MEKNKLKLCVIIPTHWEALMGGAQYQAKVLIEHLIPTDEYEIYYLARRINPEFKPHGYKIIEIGSYSGIGKYGLFFDAPKLLKVLKEIKPDIIYQHVGCSYTGVAAYYSKKSGCNFVWHLASDVDVQPWDWKLTRNIVFRYLDKKLLEYGVRRARYIVGQSEYQGQQLEQYYKRKLDALILNFHPYPKEKIDKSKPIKVVWVANFKRLKQPQVFIKLAHDLQYMNNVKFTMIGSPATDQDWHAELIAEINALSNLTYLGKLDQDDVNRCFAESHVLVNTSEYEGFSNTFIQAWMRQVPVVGMNVNPDGVFDNDKLGCFANGDYEQLKQQIVKLIEDDSYREAIAKRAESFAMDNYSEDNIKVLIDLFKS